MKDQRFSEKHVAARGDALFDGSRFRNRLSVGCGDLALPMTSKRQLEAAVLGIGAVQMDAGKDHALEQLNWRLGVPYAGFVGPVGETRCFDAIAQRHDAILVPGQGPVVGLSFVERDHAHGLGAGKKLSGKRVDRCTVERQQTLAWFGVNSATVV